MGWRHNYRSISTADNAAAVPVHSQKFRIIPGNDSAVLAALEAGVIFYGYPVFTAITLELWSDKGGSPGRLIATSSNSFARAECLTLGGPDNSGYRMLGFTMPGVPLKAGAYYHAAIRFTGYTGNDASHCGWRQVFPDPIYRTGLTIEGVAAATFPFELSVFTKKAV